MPIISVIIPVYNGEKTIEKTIKSILEQTFTDWELIIINDGSTDRTLEIISNIKDPRINIFSYKNQGQPASRNYGITHAKGEYIAFIDADDMWVENKLESQYKALQNNPQAAVAYSWTDWIDEQDQILPNKGCYVTENGKIYTQILLQNFIASGSNPLIKKIALETIGKFDETLTNAHDWDCWLRLAAKYEFIAVPQVQILYRKLPQSMSSNLLAMETSILMVIQKNLDINPSIQVIKNQILADKYAYLMYKSLEPPFLRSKGLTAIKFLCYTIKYNPAYMTKIKLLSIIIIKILIALLK